MNAFPVIQLLKNRDKDRLNKNRTTISLRNCVERKQKLHIKAIIKSTVTYGNKARQGRSTQATKRN